MSDDKILMVGINQAERESGVSKSLLRKWEVRYGFPRPVRNENGERFYLIENVQRLRKIRRLISYGFRPSKIVGLDSHELSKILEEKLYVEMQGPARKLYEQIVECLVSGDDAGLLGVLEQACMTHGLPTFVQELLPQIIKGIGQGWEDGTIAVYEEHFFSEVLRHALQRISSSYVNGAKNAKRTTVLMGTVPGELHGLGLYMLQAALSPVGANCINLGTQVPEEELIRGCLNYRAAIVCISFSSAFKVRNITSLVLGIRNKLPPDVALWVGGDGIKKIRSTWLGVDRFSDLSSAIEKFGKM